MFELSLNEHKMKSNCRFHATDTFPSERGGNSHRIRFTQIFQTINNLPNWLDCNPMSECQRCMFDVWWSVGIGKLAFQLFSCEMKNALRHEDCPLGWSPIKVCILNFWLTTISPTMCLFICFSKFANVENLTANLFSC